MKRTCLLVAMLLSTVSADAASPVFNLGTRVSGPRVMWQRGFYDPAWGEPHAVVVPRRANLQTTWQWGVAGTGMTTIPNQYIRQPGGVIDGMPSSPTPPWPSHTDQFGSGYVRIGRRG